MPEIIEGYSMVWMLGEMLETLRRVEAVLGQHDLHLDDDVVLREDDVGGRAHVDGRHEIAH